MAERVLVAAALSAVVKGAIECDDVGWKDRFTSAIVREFAGCRTYRRAPYVRSIELVLRMLVVELTKPKMYGLRNI